MAVEKNIIREAEERKVNAAASVAERVEESEYSMSNEVCCSPEFPQGCISAD